MNSSPVVVTLNRRAAAGDIRLNLGGRDKPIEGFLTVDLYDGKEVDVKADCSDLNMFETESVSEIYASHILEHWPHVKTMDVLKEWRRVLKPGSIARIAVPDFDAVIRIVERQGFTEFTQNLLWGDQGYPEAFHYAGFTFATLANKITKAGFSDVKRVRTFPYRSDDCSSKQDSFYGMYISLNVEAVA